MTRGDTRGRASRLGKASLDAAIEIDEFIRGAGTTLHKTRLILNDILTGAASHDRSPFVSSAYMAYMPYYESVLRSAHRAVPSRITDVQKEVADLINKVLKSDTGDDIDFLSSLRDVFIMVHRDEVRSRFDAHTPVRNARRGQVRA